MRVRVSRACPRALVRMQGAETLHYTVGHLWPILHFPNATHGRAGTIFAVEGSGQPWSKVDGGSHKPWSQMVAAVGGAHGSSPSLDAWRSFYRQEQHHYQLGFHQCMWL
jgi:hypothetical protein